MKHFTTLFLCLSFYAISIAQEPIRYIKTIEPVIETASPSRDDNNVYHFYFSFNWNNDSSIYSNKLNPKIEELEVYQLGEEEPFISFDAPKDSKNQIEFKINKFDIDNFDQIQYAIKWEISNTSGQRLSNVTNRKTLRINFVTDRELKVNISSERLYYIDDINKPRIKIKTTRDGIAVKSLKLLLQPRPDATSVAEVKNDIVRINSNIFTELVFESSSNIELKEEQTYFLYGSFRDNDSGQEVSFPLPNMTNNDFQINKKTLVTIKPLETEGKNIVVQGNSPFNRVFDATGEALEVTATLKMESHGYREFKLDDAKNQRWKLNIPGDPNIPFGTFILEFTGMGKNRQPLKPATFSYTKTPIKRKVIQMEVKDNVYEAIAEFTAPPTGKVYLVIEGKDVEMNKSSSNPNSYSVNFSFDDQTLQEVSKVIKNQPDNKKRVLITTKVNGIENEGFLAKNAAVVDMKELEGKKKKEIKEYLEKIGFEENVDKLAKNISAELKKDEKDRDWDSNVWAGIVEWAPKAIPLILMLL